MHRLKIKRLLPYTVQIIAAVIGCLGGIAGLISFCENHTFFKNVGYLALPTGYEWSIENSIAQPAPCLRTNKIDHNETAAPIILFIKGAKGIGEVRLESEIQNAEWGYTNTDAKDWVSLKDRVWVEHKDKFVLEKLDFKKIRKEQKNMVLTFNQYSSLNSESIETLPVFANGQPLSQLSTFTPQEMALEYLYASIVTIFLCIMLFLCGKHLPKIFRFHTPQNKLKEPSKPHLHKHIKTNLSQITDKHFPSLSCKYKVFLEWEEYIDEGECKELSIAGAFIESDLSAPPLEHLKVRFKNIETRNVQTINAIVTNQTDSGVGLSFYKKPSPVKKPTKLIIENGK